MDEGTARDRTLRLEDGRRLGFADYGDPDGRPVVGLHGTPGSRLMLEIADRPARRLGVRLIAPDRPGFGLSDPMPERRYPDFARDVEALLDHLGLERVALAGVSGGGPYALACAAHMPARISNALIVSGVAPLAGADGTPGLALRHRLIFGLGARAPRALRALTAYADRAWRRDPERVFERIVRMNPPWDRVIMTRPEVRSVLIAALQDAFRRGGGPPATEIALFGRPWGFRLRDVTVPIRLWHGEADRLVPVAMGRHLARLLPDCRPAFIPGAGHYWVFDHIDQLLEAVSRPAADVGP